MTTTSVRRRRVALLLSLTSALVACGRHDEDADHAPPTPVVTSIRSASAPPDVLRPGDLRIVTADTAVDLALIGDTISAGLSQHTLEKVRRETDTTRTTDRGFAASMGTFVKRTVANAIGTRVSIPLSAVRDVRYAGGTIQFDWVGRPVQLFTDSKEHGRPVLASFPPTDAQRFVDAVRARKAQRATTP